MSTARGDSEFNHFILGMIICCGMWVIFMNIADKHISIEDIQKAEEVCENNQGINFIQYNMVNKNKSYCVNGAVFKIRGE